MRLIEKEMNHAVDNGLDWAKDNTQVVIDSIPRAYFADVYLHGNYIAVIYCNMAGERQVKPILDTLRDYPTRTTMSRLRALGVDVCTRKGVVHLDGKPL